MKDTFYDDLLDFMYETQHAHHYLSLIVCFGVLVISVFWMFRLSKRLK